MRIDYAHSERGTLGIEWELGLVDRRTRRLVSAADGILDRIRGTEIEPLIQRELLLNTVEVTSSVHHRVGDAIEEIKRATDAIQHVAPEHVALFCAGTHPSELAAGQPYTPSTRYEKLIDRTQYWGRQMLIYGVHVHVGVDRPEYAIPVVAQLVMHYYPHLQALSAASPWWEGDLTGYASNRAMIFQQLPTAGLPPDLATWEEFEAFVGDECATGVIGDVNELRFDVRPAPRFGTVESRICDGMPTSFEVAAIAALTQCLVVRLCERLDADDPLPRLPPWHVRENKWRAARYGLATEFIVDAANHERAVTDDLADLLTELEPVADRLGCSRELASVDELVRAGASYQRQLRVASAPGASLDDVVDALLDEFAAGTPAGV
jgi:carboxylate-amine ligase